MDPKESTELTVNALLSLRRQKDALRIITEKLRVKEMGPADHIRTKHEVKAFIETGDVKAAETIIKQASERTATAQQANTNRMREEQRHERRMSH